MSHPSRHLQCPFCEAYEVERLYLASLRIDACACASCGARWESDPVTGEYLGRGSRENIERSPRPPRAR